MRKQKDDMQVNVAGLRRNIKNLAHNYSDAQVKVREATSNDPWGPSATIMAEIADLTYNVVAFSEIMQMIWKRLNDHGKNWRHVYKALILLEYLIKTGTEKVAQQCKENIFAIQTLREFVYFEEGKDQGTHVREKAKQLVNLLKDDERLKNERIKALKAKERFAQHPSGFGSDGYIDGPTQRDMPPGWQEEPKTVSELELVRPQTAGEEELQLQLAMAMSREEAEQEEAKRRSDDVRLQLALSQSEQDFKDQTVKPNSRKEEPHSHLLDLLDISLGATSISSPPLGAMGGTGSDPWGTPARAASQLSDPWSGTSSPQIDPWQPAAAMRTATASAPLGAVGGIGSNGDAWGLTRTQSPSVASGSSTEGWLQSNGGVSGNATAVLNGNSIGTGAMGGVDPWLSKSGAIRGAAVPDNVEPVNDWLTESVKPITIAPLEVAPAGDPWAPKHEAAGSADPWKTTEKSVTKKRSPDLDEFDIITNRNKTADLLTSSPTTASNNNNASLLDEMDPLSATNSSLNAAAANAKKQMKTPQSFLGENSALVNLDNLIKPVQTQPQAGNAAYNPFSDTVIPPKTNLFQQQQPAVPSINQLKQQQPFAMAMNQDPWAPVSNATNASQLSRNYFTERERNELTTFHSSNNNNNNNNSSSSSGVKHSMPYSKSDFDVFNSSFASSNDYFNYNNMNSNQLDDAHQFQTQVQVHSHSVDNIRNMQIASDNDTDIYELASSSMTHNRQAPPINSLKATTTSNTLVSQTSSVALTNPYQPFTAFNAAVRQDTASITNVNNNKRSFDLQPTISEATFTGAPLAASYSNALTAALADTPGIKIAPVPVAAMPPEYGIPPVRIASGGMVNSGVSTGGNISNSNGGSLFNYGFYDATSSLNSNNNNTNNNAIFSTASSLGNCKLENNNNMPWMNPDAASSSNPFLS